MRGQSRRAFLQKAGMAAGAALVSGARTRAQDVASRRMPNVILIITDDQGYGDLSCHGNPVLKTPNLDRLHAESTRFTRFHVCPVCSPTRACLMTGRYNYRTGVVDTYIGRSMMHPDEVTIAEAFSQHGYRTGIFGKWHLGDNYPMRAKDQGFQESLVHRGGGLSQPSDPPDSGYFDPVLSRNGTLQKCRGYCTDVFTDAALAFIEANRDRPFFAYLAMNAPHVPLEIDERYVAPYRTAGVGEGAARVYGMIANIDENAGRVMDLLAKRDIERDTIVIFMTDNGATPAENAERYNAGMRGWKGSVYEGGIRVPFFIRWPGVLEAGRDIYRIAAHIDVLPTLLALCGAPVPEEVRLDGRSLAPLLLGAGGDWPDRYLFSQWHRGDAPEPFRQCAALNQRYKLVDGKELYDLENDPAEARDIAPDYPRIVQEIRAAYEAWFEDVCSTRGFAPMRIHLGTPHENPTVLTRQDWRNTEGWDKQHVGHWEVLVATEGEYDLLLQFPPAAEGSKARFRLGDTERSVPLTPGATSCAFESVPLQAGDGQLEAFLEQGGNREGVRYVDVLKK